MIPLSLIRPLGGELWEIPASARSDMRVPARFYAQEEMVSAFRTDRSLEQLMNVAALPGIQTAAIGMPDLHEGYGFPIGGIGATSHPHGCISPGGIGYDINCGVRMLLSRVDAAQVEPYLEDLCRELFRRIPSGPGKQGLIKLETAGLDEVLSQGARWAVRNGFGMSCDLESIESGGCLEEADPIRVSQEAKSRGLDQLGSIGSGNHFAEVARVDMVFDTVAAAAFGLSQGQVCVLIHSGSRGLGHQVATDHLRIMAGTRCKYGDRPHDRQLANAPFESPEGQGYYKAMAAAANFAWCNRQILAEEVRRAWARVMGKASGSPALNLDSFYDVAHNIAKIESHSVDGRLRKLIVHRKGATRAFGPGNAEIPLAFRAVGQPVLVPGSMGTASYVLAGCAGNEAAFSSSCHGAGRRLSRKAARERVDPDALRQAFLRRGIHIAAVMRNAIAEEAPVAYRNVEDVVATMECAGLAKRVARLVPMAVIKG